MQKITNVDEWIYQQLSDPEKTKKILILLTKDSNLNNKVFFINKLLSTLPENDQIPDLLRFYFWSLQKRSGLENKEDEKLSSKIENFLNQYNPTDDGNNAIKWAVYEGHLEVVKLLLEAKDEKGKPRVDPAADDNDAIKWAASNGHLEVVKLLLEAKDEKGEPRVDSTNISDDILGVQK